jgi:hypothetical protein
MTHITRIIVSALAALAIGAPAASAMLPTDTPVGPQTGTAATGTPSACPTDTRAVHGPAGSGCTTSPRYDSDEPSVFAVSLAGAAAFAIALGAGAAAAGRHGRRSTAAAFSERTS